MLPVDLSKAEPKQLLELYAATVDALRTTGVIRSSNNPVCDYAEWLVSRALGLSLVGRSQSGYDAVDASGTRFQVKSRRQTRYNPSTQLGVIRNLDGAPFDYVIAVLFSETFDVKAAYKIPLKTIAQHAKFRSHVNGHIMMLRGALLTDPATEDVTVSVRDAAQNWTRQSPAPPTEATPVVPRKGQRQMMRELVRRLGPDRDSVLRAYAEAETRGEVERASNQSGLSPEDYAGALWADGVHKGWLKP